MSASGWSLRMPRVSICRFILLGLALAAPSACGGHSSSGDPRSTSQSPKECDAYADAYGACMRRLSPGNLSIASARTANARHALEGITESVRLRQTCVDGLAQLQTSCR